MRMLANKRMVIVPLRKATHQPPTVVATLHQHPTVVDMFGQPMVIKTSLKEYSVVCSFGNFLKFADFVKVGGNERHRKIMWRKAV
jgi:hypothetical protein